MKKNQPEFAIFNHVSYKRYHSSPFSGRPVLDAGMIVIVGGKVAFIENKSGHYQPKLEQKLHTLRFLKKGGMNLKDIFVSERVPDNYKADPRYYEDLIENYFEEKLYNAADIYNWYTLIDLRHKDTPKNEVAKLTAVDPPPPTVNIPSKGKNDLTPLATLTHRNWGQLDAKGRPQKPLKSSRTSVHVQ